MDKNSTKPQKKGFTETISFYHNRSSSAIVENSLSTPFEHNGNILNMTEAIAIPFLLTQEYVYTLDSPIEHDRLINFSSEQSSNNKIVLNLVIGRIKQFSVSTNDNFKQMFLENIPCYIECLGLSNASNYLIPALSKIVDETIELKIQFLKVCRNIIDHFHSKGKAGYYLIANNMVRLINELYTIQSIRNQQMKELLFDNYLNIASCLDEEDLGKFLLTKIIIVSIDNNTSLNSVIESENVSLIAKLIINLADKFSIEHCETFIISNMKMFSDNSNEKIREIVCTIIPPVAKAITLPVFQKKINEELYAKLTKDSNESVRKKAVEILPELMRLYQEKSGFDSFKYTNAFYIEVFKRLMLENNTLVHTAVMSIFGQYIQLLSFDEIEPVYLNFFANTIDEYYSNLKQNYSIEGKRDLLYPAAFNFPAVLYRYGKDSWPKLKKPFESLAKDNDDHIKFTLLASFNEVVSILGKEITEKELMLIYDSFIINSSIKISNEAIKRLMKIISGLSNDIKFKYLKYYTSTIPIDEDNKINFEHTQFKNWRHKVETCKAIDCFFTLYPPIVIFHQILPVLILFCIDDYAKVRQACASTLGRIILFLLNNSQMKKFALRLNELIVTFGYSKCFYVRQTFCKLSQKLLCDQGLYQRLLKDIMFKLAYDKVKDVRVSLGKMCCYVLKKKTVETNYLLFDDDFYLLMSILIEDQVLSVRNSILMQKHKINMKKLIEKCNEVKAKKQLRNNGIELEGNKAGKGYYLFNNEMKFFAIEFKICLPNFVLKRIDKTNDDNDFTWIIEEARNIIPMSDTTNNGIKVSNDKSIITALEDIEINNQIENGASNTEDKGQEG